MFDFVTRIQEYELMLTELNLKSSEARIISEASNLVTRGPDRDGWTKAFAVTDREKGHLEPDQLEMIRQARKKYRWEPNAKGAIRTMVNYIMGEGISITPKSKDPMAWYVWREFWTAKRNSMSLRQFEIIARTLRDGEVFIEFFDRDVMDSPTGKTTIRFLDPLLVKNPSDERGFGLKGFVKDVTRSGIQHDKDDIESVLGYWVESNNDTKTGQFRFVPAEKVHHIKLDADSDQKRGESFLQPILNMLTQYEQWLTNRIILNKMRSAIVMVRTMEGTPTQLASVVNNLKQSATARAGDVKRESFRGGTILTATGGVKYEMLSPNINASDVAEDGRNIKLNMAAGTNLPEYVFGDASNANFASTMIAESPFVKAVKFFQTFFEYHFCQIYKKVIENAVAVKLIEPVDEIDFLKKLKGVSDLTEQDDEGIDRKAERMKELFPDGTMEIPSEIFYGCDMQWPEIVHRVEKDLTGALQIQRASGWVSDASASQRLGYDYAEEVRKQKNIEEDAAQSGNPLMGMNQQDMKDADDDGHIEKDARDAMKSLTNEQRQAIMNAKTPEEVLKVLKIPVPAGNGTNGEE